MIDIKLLDLMSLIIYSYSAGNKGIDKYTLERIVFLFYQIKDFLDGGISGQNQNSTLSNGVLSVVGFDELLSSISRSATGVLVNEEGFITVNEKFIETIQKLLEQDGDYSDTARVVMPFLNVIRKYTPQLVFSIFLSEPDFTGAMKRNASTIPSKESQLAKLLNEFRCKINNDDISDYDIIATWMEFVLSSLNKGYNK